jgi:hypothetical protein
MNNLLIWPLTETDKIIFSSSTATLATITCCDPIDLVFKTDSIDPLNKNLTKYQLVSGLTGCQLSSFKNELMFLINQTKTEATLAQVLSISYSKLGHVLLKIQYQNSTLGYFLINLEAVQAWNAQLDLLEVVMQENENEKKSKSSGCC